MYDEGSNTHNASAPTAQSQACLEHCLADAGFDAAQLKHLHAGVRAGSDKTISEWLSWNSYAWAIR